MLFNKFKTSRNPDLFKTGFLWNLEFTFPAQLDFRMNGLTLNMKKLSSFDEPLKFRYTVKQIESGYLKMSRIYLLGIIRWCKNAKWKPPAFFTGGISHRQDGTLLILSVTNLLQQSYWLQKYGVLAKSN